MLAAFYPGFPTLKHIKYMVGATVINWLSYRNILRHIKLIMCVKFHENISDC